MTVNHHSQKLEGVKNEGWNATPPHFLVRAASKCSHASFLF